MNLPLQELIEKLQNGSLSAVHALEAYRAKSLAVHEKTNCLTELIWEAEVLMTIKNSECISTPVKLMVEYG